MLPATPRAEQACRRQPAMLRWSTRSEMLCAWTRCASLQNRTRCQGPAIPLAEGFPIALSNIADNTIADHASPYPFNGPKDGGEIPHLIIKDLVELFKDDSIQVEWISDHL